MPYFSVKNRDYFFLHLPKTGGRTIEKIFQPYLPHDARGIGQGHEYLRGKPESFSFCILRNPLDRLVSVFHYLKKGGIWQGDLDDAKKYDILDNSFPDWVNLLYNNPTKYFRQQHIEPISNRIPVFEWIDEYFLFDVFDSQVKGLFENVTGDTLEEVPKVNQSKHDGFMTYYDDDLKNKVAELYGDDFTMYEKVKTSYEALHSE